MPFPTFAKQEEIPESFRDEYVEKDGKWVPKEDDGAQLKGALEKEREARAEEEKKRKASEQELAALKRAQLAKQHNLSDEQLAKVREEVRGELSSEFSEKIAELETKASGSEKTAAENQALLLETRTKQLMIENGVRPERVEKMWKAEGSSFELSTDGKPAVKGKAGADVKKFVGEALKKEYPEFYVGTKAAGGGSSGVHNGTAEGISGVDVLANPTEAMNRARAQTK